MMIVSSIILLRILLLLLMLLHLVIVGSDSARYPRLVRYDHLFGRRVNVGLVHHGQIIVVVLRVQQVRVVQLVIVKIVHPLVVASIKQRPLLLVELL